MKLLLVLLLVISIQLLAEGRTITITYPYTGAVFKANETATTNWVYWGTDLSYIEIDLMAGTVQNNTFIAMIANNVNPKDQTYTTSIPPQAPTRSDYFLRFVGFDASKNVLEMDYSDYFTIDTNPKQRLSFTYPYAGLKFQGNENITANWILYANDIQYLNLDLMRGSTNNAVVVKSIANNINPYALTYTFQLPSDIPTRNNYFLRLSSYSYSNTFLENDDSDTFTIQTNITATETSTTSTLPSATAPTSSSTVTTDPPISGDNTIWSTSYFGAYIALNIAVIVALLL